MRRVAALLKGVNVGGNRKLPMAELAAFVTALGFVDARTLLASGNAVFAAEGAPAELEALLEREAEARLGLRTAFLVRDAADLDAVIAAAPFAEALAARPNHVVAVFGGAPAPALLDRLAAEYQGPERLAIVGGELVIDYAEGIGESKLGQAMVRLRFPARATGRNWNTLLKLRAMLD